MTWIDWDLVGLLSLAPLFFGLAYAAMDGKFWLVLSATAWCVFVLVMAKRQHRRSL